MDNELEKRLQKLEMKAQRALDYWEISNLHGRYNHLLLGHYWDEIVDTMFCTKTPGVKAEIAESGVYHGIEGVRKVFVEVLGKLYNYKGNLALHELTTPVIEIEEDGQTARGMWYTWGANTFYDPKKGSVPIWQSLRYNHIFKKEDGRWKWWDYRAHLIIRSRFENGWIKEPYIKGSTIKGPKPDPNLAPDEPTTLFDPFDPKGDYKGLPLPPKPIYFD
jgi:hypothetical protein